MKHGGIVAVTGGAVRRSFDHDALRKAAGKVEQASLLLSRAGYRDLTRAAIELFNSIETRDYRDHVVK